MNARSAESVIFRQMGGMKSTTSYCLPDFLYTYVIAGSGTVSAGHEEHEFSAGDSFVVARRQEATVTLMPDEEMEKRFHTLSIRISKEDIEDYFLHNMASVKAASTPAEAVQLLPDHPLLHGLNLLLEDGLQQGFRAEWEFTKMKIQECIHILVTLNARMYGWLAARNQLQKINLREFMERNFRHNVPLDQLAVATGRSLSTFRRDFISIFGTTPSRWLIRRRLEEARSLILAGNRPGDILVELGFESFSHFTRCFKQQYGVLPSAMANAQENHS